MEEELTSCIECEADLTAEDSVAMKYVITLTGRLDDEGRPVPHTMEELTAALQSATLDSMECYECSEVIDFR